MKHVVEIVILTVSINLFSDLSLSQTDSLPPTVHLKSTRVSPRDLTLAEKSKIIRVVTREFFDPASAQFRWDKLVNDTKYCGYVNGKNRFGGYVGFRPFSALIFYTQDYRIFCLTGEA